MTITGASPAGSVQAGKGGSGGAGGSGGTGGTPGSPDGAPGQDGVDGAAGQAGSPGQASGDGVAGSPTQGGAAGPATRFVFSPILGAASSGVNFGYPIYVVAEDGAGNVVPDYSETVTLSANTVADPNIPGTIDQSLGAVDSAGANFGLAIFNNVNISYGGPSMDFEASGAGISSVTGTFSVSYSPQQIKAAYGINQLTETGAGQTIAIVDAYNDPNIAADLTAFDTAYGLPAPPSFQVFNQTGQVINPANTAVPMDPLGGWEGEEALDVEWAHAMAPGASIDFVVSNSNDSNANTDMLAAVNAAAKLPGVSVVSMSFSGGDNVDNSILYQSEFSTELSDDSALSTIGVTFVASSGDDGAPSGYPSYSPNVVSVGGTALYINPDNSYAREIGWSLANDAGRPNAAAGGGVSTFETEPSYQAGVQTTGQRTAPDVAMVADSNTGVAVLDTFNNKGWIAPWSGVGGTSVSAPCFAGLIALVNQGRVESGKSALNTSSTPGQPNPEETLRAIYSMPAADFHKGITGNNGAPNAMLTNASNYNEIVGLGTPVANLLVPALIAYTSNGVALSPVSFGSDGSVNYGYVINGANLTASTTVDLYWASGTTVADVIGGPIMTTTTETEVGTWPINVPRSDLGDAPDGATDLLVVVVDPGTVVADADPGKVEALALPVLSITQFDWNTTALERGVDFGYSIAASDLPVATTISFFWANGVTQASIIGPAVDQTDDQEAIHQIATAQGDFPYDASNPVNNDPARWGVPPAGATYILAIADYDDKDIKVSESPDNDVLLVSTLPLATQAAGPQGIGRRPDHQRGHDRHAIPSRRRRRSQYHDVRGRGRPRCRPLQLAPAD